MIRAVLFDIDGTLLDTWKLVVYAFEHALKEQGISIDRDTIVTTVGPPLPETYKLLAPGADTDLLVETHRSFQVDNLHLSVSFPNVQETLQKIQDKGIKMSAITNRSKRSSIKTLELASLDHFFEIVLSAEDMKNNKPHPEGLFTALKHMGIEPKDALMVGDTEADILAGQAAGVKTVGITHGMRGEKVKDHNPDHLIHSIEELLTIIENG
jgi:pyrophosphatase PpaX